jgi:signal transduction histidine kinase
MENPEFRLDDTWKNIFHEFIELGTNKIKDILLREVLMKAESQIAAIENKKAIMSLLYLRGNLTHKFGTLIKHHGSAITKMTGDLDNSGVTLPENIYSDVESLRTSYEELQKLARAMFKDARHIKLDDISEEELNKRPSDLCAAIEIVQNKMKLNLDHSEIKIDLPSPNANGLMVDVPFLVVYLSIFNLLSNAINALRLRNKRSRSKRISISTRVNGHRILCRVKDTGPGFDNTDQLYELDAGWGLYLTKVSLEDYNSSLDLVENSPSGATFELSFPVRRHESEPIPWRISNAS